LEFFNNFSSDSILFLITYFIICISSFHLGGYFKKIGLPTVTGLIIVGVLVGPSSLNIIDKFAIDNLNFLFDLSLGFIAFAAGSELFFKEIQGSFNSIKWNTLSSIFITFLIGFCLVGLTLIYIPYFDDISTTIKFYISLLSASIFVARSPASAIAVINDLKAKGKFTSTSMGVLCLSDFGVILLFAVVFSIIKSIDLGSFQFYNIIIIIFEIIFSIGFGIVYGIFINNFLNISIKKYFKYFLLILIGFSSFLFASYIREASVSLLEKEIIFEPLLICMVAGIYIINRTNKRLEFLDFIQVSGKYIYVVFFTLVGASLDIPLVLDVFEFALLFFLLRLISLFVSAYVGGTLAKDDFNYKILGWTPHITQAGVSLGLIQIFQQEFNYWPNEIINQISLILVSSIILSQFLGPTLFKWALSYLNESNKREEIVLSEKKRVLIFGLEPQSISIALILKSRKYIVDIIYFENKPSIKIPEGIGHKRIKDIDKYNFDFIDYSKSDSVICFCSDDVNEEICDLSFSTYGNKNVIVRINDHLKADIFLNFKVKIIHPSDAIVNLIDQYVRSPQGTSLFLGEEKDKEIRDLRLLNDKISGSLLRDLKLPQDILMLSIKRNDEIILSHGYTRLLKDDIITFIGSVNSLDKLTLRFDS
jgi:Kef-type K+ transport system membrane component KefB